MSLENTINDAIKTAMKEKDKVALDSLRAVKSQILLLKTEAKGAEVSAEQEIAILQRMIKQRKDSFEQFVAQGRNDLAEVEEAQMKVIEKYTELQFGILLLRRATLSTGLIPDFSRKAIRALISLADSR